MGVAVDREAPFYFTKAAEHYVPSGSTVPYPPGTSNYHYELELVVVIGAPAFRVPAQGALDCVFGYACGLDMTRRDLQFAAREQRRPWDLGKDVEQSAVLSEIVPSTEIGHPTAGLIELSVNGELKQRAHLAADSRYQRSPLVLLPSAPGDLIYRHAGSVGPVIRHGRGTIWGWHKRWRSAPREASMLKGCVPWPEKLRVDTGLASGRASPSRR